MSQSSWVKRRTSWLGKFTLLEMVMTIVVILVFDMQQFRQGIMNFLVFPVFAAEVGVGFTGS